MAKKTTTKKKPTTRRAKKATPAPDLAVRDYAPSDDLTFREFQVRLDTLDTDNRTVEATIATDTPVTVYDMKRWEPVLETLVMDGVVLPKTRQVPMLDAHNRFTLGSVIGSTRDIRVEGNALVARNHFADTDSGRSAFELVRDKHVTDNSIGYRVTESTIVEPGKKKKINGRFYTAPGEMPLRVSTQWEVKENSIVPIGADRNAKNRSEPGTDDREKRRKRLFLEIRTMGFEKWLTERGLKLDDLSEDHAAVLRADYDRAQIVTHTPAPEPDAQAIEKEGAEKERARVAAIRQMAEGITLPAEILNRCIDEGLDIEQARTEMFNVLRQTQLKQTAVSAPMAIVRNCEVNTEILTAGLLLRAGMEKEATAMGEETVNRGGEVRDLDLRTLAIESLAIDHQIVPRNRDDMVRAAFSTQTLPIILGNVANKSLLAGYNLNNASWMQWTTPGSVSDFKTQTRARDTDTFDLQEIPNGGEIPYGGTSEESETFKIATYAKNFGISRQDIINDDLSVFTSKPRKMGAKAQARVSKLVYEHFMGNPTMGDAVALFHSTHSNLNTSAALASSTLATALKGFRNQTDSEGEPIMVEPKFLMVPPGLENTARGLVEADLIMQAGSTDATITTKNIYKGALSVIVDPRLENANYTNYSATTWYLVAAGGNNDTVEVAFLNGKREPTIARFDNGPTVQGLTYQVYIDAGVKALDWRTVCKNTA